MTYSTSLQNHSAIDDGISIDIKNMVKEKGKTCISIIIPTHRIGSDRQGDHLEIERSVLVAKNLVQYEPKLLKAIDALLETIDYTHNKEGLGLFVSLNIKKLIKFPFPVTKKVVVSKYFHLHDLINIENYKVHYYLLDLSKKEIRLFHGVMDLLEEITENNFPKKIIEEYEYNKPSQSTSYAGYAHEKGFEKDKSILQQIRLKNIFNEADKSLLKFLGTKNHPLILCGSTKVVDLYKSVTDFSDNIVAIISDNFQYTDIHELEIFAWEQIQSFIDRQKLKLVNEFKEKIGEGLGVYGIEDVWQATREGKGFKLLVEKDYGKPAFVTRDNKLLLKGPQEKYTRHSDVVNDIITTVLEKNGNVTILEKDNLKDYKRIALINRY